MQKATKREKVLTFSGSQVWTDIITENIETRSKTMHIQSLNTKCPSHNQQYKNMHIRIYTNTIAKQTTESAIDQQTHTI